MSSSLPSRRALLLACSCAAAPLVLSAPVVLSAQPKGAGAGTRSTKQAPKTVFKPVPAVAFSPSIRRQPDDSLWTRVWIAGADSSADLFIEPRQIAASGDVVVVLDVGSREARALDARTGATRFVLHAAGDGPGEFRRPSLLTNAPNGFALVDQANARVTVFDRTGRFRWSAAVRDVFSMNGLCVGDSGRVLSTLTRRDSSIVESDSLGRVRSVRSVPWQQMVKGGVGFAYSHFTSNTVNGRCLIAPNFGSEWAAVPMSGGPTRFALLEPGAQPVVTITTSVLDRSPTQIVRSQNQQSDTKQASRGVLLLGDTAIVYAAHTQNAPLHWLDYYRVSTGEYLYSRKLPFIANAITVDANGVFYATNIGESKSVVVAIKPHAK